MTRSDAVLAMFSAEIEDDEGTPVIEVPAREVEMGSLEVGEAYRVALLARDGAEEASSGRSGGSSRSGRSRPSGDDPPVEEGEVRDFEIEDIGDQGDGIARVGPGYIVFVPDTKVGDRVTVEITQVLDNFAFAEVIEAEPVSG